MLTAEQIVRTLRENKPFLQSEMGVKNIGLFGSYAKGTQQSGSDIDVYVEMEQNDYNKLVRVLLFLESQFPVKIDLIHKHKKMRSSFLRTLEAETIYA